VCAAEKAFAIDQGSNGLADEPELGGGETGGTAVSPIAGTNHVAGPADKPGASNGPLPTENGAHRTNGEMPVTSASGATPLTGIIPRRISLTDAIPRVKPNRTERRRRRRK
jgi:hypothetical protein